MLLSGKGRRHSIGRGNGIMLMITTISILNMISNRICDLYFQLLELVYNRNRIPVMNRHYRNSFERKQYIDSIIEEYRTKKINRDSNSSSKKDLKTSDQSNSNLSKHHDEYQLRKTSNEDEKSKSNNMQEFESTVSTTHNKNQMSDEYQKPQGLGKATVSTKDGHFEQQMHKSLYSQKL